MKLLHLADLHIGKRVNNFPMIEDQRFALSRVLEMIQEHDVDALLLAGDIYDKTSPSEEAVRLFDWFLSQMAAIGKPVIAVPGNHDSADRLAYAQSLLAKQGVFFPPVFDGELSTVVLEDEHGPVTLWMIPFLRPVDVRRVFPEADIAGDYTAAIKTVVDAATVDRSARNVAIAHQFVTSAGSSPERASDEINLGGVDNVDVAAFEAFDYVALGHVHRPQRIGRDTARYAGSLLKYSYSEINYPKSAVLVELGPKAAGEEPDQCASFSLLPIPSLRDMREIRGPLSHLISAEVVAAADSDDYIHAVLTDEVPQIDALDKLRSAYPNIMTLDYDNSFNKAEGVSAIEAVDPDDIDPVELFSEFFEAVAGHELLPEQAELASKCIFEAVNEKKVGA